MLLPLSLCIVLLVFLNFGAGPMGIWPLPSAVPHSAGHVFWGNFAKKCRMPLFSRPFCTKVAESMHIYGTLCKQAFQCPLFCRTSCARIKENMHIYGTLCKQAFECPLFCGTFCTKVAESMHIYAVFPPRQQKVCSYPHPYVLFCLVFLSFGAGPMAIWPLLSVVPPRSARHVFYRQFSKNVSNACDF